MIVSVFLEVAGPSSHQGVHPEGVVGAVSELVMLNNPQAVPQVVRVQGWIQSISRGAEWAQSIVAASVLLTCQILEELARGKVLVAFVLEILALDELGFELLYV